MLTLFFFVYPRYLSKPFEENAHVSLDGRTLDSSLLDVTQITSTKREIVFEEVLLNGRQRADLPLTRLFVTKEERETASQLKNLKKADLVKRIEEPLVEFRW